MSLSSEQNIVNNDTYGVRTDFDEPTDKRKIRVHFNIDQIKEVARERTKAKKTASNDVKTLPDTVFDNRIYDTCLNIEIGDEESRDNMK